jgi:hypothetical protein
MLGYIPFAVLGPSNSETPSTQQHKKTFLYLSLVYFAVDVVFLTAELAKSLSQRL